MKASISSLSSYYDKTTPSAHPPNDNYGLENWGTVKCVRWDVKQERVKWLNCEMCRGPIRRRGPWEMVIFRKALTSPGIGIVLSVNEWMETDRCPTPWAQVSMSTRIRAFHAPRSQFVKSFFCLGLESRTRQASRQSLFTVLLYIVQSASGFQKIRKDGASDDSLCCNIYYLQFVSGAY
jgi:hypothetical protein